MNGCSATVSGTVETTADLNLRDTRGVLTFNHREITSGSTGNILGNPLAAVSGLLTLAEPLLRGLASRPAAEPYTAPLRADVHGHPQDTRLVPVVLRGEHAVPLHYNGPAMLRGIAVADGLAVIPPGGARRGRELEILDLPWTEPGVLPGELGIGGPDDEVCFT